MGNEGNKTKFELIQRLISRIREWLNSLTLLKKRQPQDVIVNSDAQATQPEIALEDPANQAESIQGAQATASQSIQGQTPSHEVRQASLTTHPNNEQPSPATEIHNDATEVSRAAWQTNPATDPWYPEKFKNKLLAIKYYQYQDNYGIERRAANDWHIIGATRRGKKHAHDATYREDAFADETTDKFTVLCVADGAGAYPYSRIGSQYATNELVHHLSSQLTRGAEKQTHREHVQFSGFLAEKLQKSIHHVINSLNKYAEKNDVSPKDFRCTLLTALFYHDERHQVVLLNQIGDGAICIYNKETGETEKLGGEGESGIHSGEVSRFVPDKESLKMNFHVLPEGRMKDVDGIMLCSDGIEDPFYPMEKNSAHIFRQFYNGVKPGELSDLGITQVEQPHVYGHPTEGASLENWMTFEKKGESDDRTVLAMFRG